GLLPGGQPQGCADDRSSDPPLALFVPPLGFLLGHVFAPCWNARRSGRALFIRTGSTRRRSHEPTEQEPVAAQGPVQGPAQPVALLQIWQALQPAPSCRSCSYHPAPTRPTSTP